MKTLLLISIIILSSCGGGGGQSTDSNNTYSPNTRTEIRPVESDFVYKAVSYVDNSQTQTSKQLELGVAHMDWWGKSYNLSHTRFEPSKEYVDSFTKRIGQIGSKLLLVSDTYFMNNNLDIYVQTHEGAMTFTQNELNNIVTKARENNQSNVIMITNVAAQTSDVLPLIESLHPRGDRTLINKLFDNWKNLMNIQAQRAELAGFDAMIINPREVYMFFALSDTNNLEQDATNINYWQDIIDIVKSSFSGKVYFWGNRGFLSDVRMNVSNNSHIVDGFVVDEDIQSILNLDMNTYNSNTISENINYMKNKWLGFFNEGNMITDLGNSGDLYLLTLMPSYKKNTGETGIQLGWLEPWAEYPDYLYVKDEVSQTLMLESLFETIYDNSFPINGFISYGYWWSNSQYPTNYWQRSDLSHSIRTKDAENIFYKYSQLFNN